MNTRQKAKYYKRKYEELANMPLSKFTVTKIVKGREDKLVDVITRDLANELVSQMDKYVTVQTSFEPHLNQYKITADVKVVRTQVESEE